MQLTLAIISVLGKADRPLFVTSNRCISVRNALGLKGSRVLCISDSTGMFCSVLLS
jgi:hypothetical protein